MLSSHIKTRPARTRLRINPNIIIVAAGLLGLGACQSNSVSLNEAKQISIELEKVSVQAPPRTASDIVELLNSRPPEFQKERQSFLKTFNTQIKTKAPGKQRLKELEDRANAAVQLGQAQTAIQLWQQIEREAASTKNKISVVSQGTWTWNLAIAYLSGGDIAKSYTTLKKAAHIFRNGKSNNPFVEGNRLGRLAALEAYLALRLLQFGDINNAKIALKNSETARIEFEGILDLAAANNVTLAKSTLQAVSMAKAAALMAKGEDARLAGNLRQAEKWYRDGRAVLELDDVAIEGFHSKVQHDVWEDITARLAITLKDQGRPIEAESEARSAVRKAFEIRGPIGSQTVDTLLSFNEILISQRRFKDTHALLEAALRMMEASSTDGASWLAFRANQQYAVSTAGIGYWGKAAELYQKLESGLSENNSYLAANIGSDPSRTMIYLAAGNYPLALKAAQEEAAWATQVYPKGHFSIAEARGMEAAAFMESGQPAKARRILDEILPTLINTESRLQRNIRENPFRRERLRAAFNAYVSLIGENPDSKSIDAAFQLAQAVRESSVVSAISANALRSSVTDPELAELIRREQDTGKLINALHSQKQNALSLPKAQQQPELLLAMQEKIRSARLAREALGREIETQFPDYLKKSAPGTISIATLQKSLRQDESFIVIESSPAASYVWAVAAKGQPRFAKSYLGRDEIKKTVRHLRTALAPEGISTIGDIPEFDLAKAYNLYRQLLLPVRSAWGDAKAIVMVTDGALNTLPLALLPTDSVAPNQSEDVLFARYKTVPWLIRTHEISQVPSVATFTTLRAAPYKAPEFAFLGFGNPVFNTAPDEISANASTRGSGFSLRAAPDTQSMTSANIGELPQLPDTETEIMEIASVMKADVRRDVYLGPRASEKTVQALNTSGSLAKYKVISFATHGLRAGELDGLTEPALALSNPALSGGGNDGFLTMSEIFKLKLNARMAVLSACNTASGELDNSEAVSGLGRAFFYAGTRSLLVSNWSVFSASTTDLMIKLFANPSSSLRAAHQQAMVAQIDQSVHKTADGKTAFSYAHPLFWAPFSFVGDGGRGAVTN